MQAEGRLVGRTVQPGVDLGDPGGGGPAAVGGGFPQRALCLRGAEGAPGGRLHGLRLAGGLDLKPVQPRLELKLTREGFALVGLGAQAVDLVAVLIALVAVRINAVSGVRRRGLGLGGGGDAGEGERQKGQPSGHAFKMGRDIIVSKRRRNSLRPEPFRM